MRRSIALLKTAKQHQHGWYNRFLELGPDGFKKNKPPTPFDWKANNIIRPRAYFDIKLDDENLGRITFELANDIVPNTVENFRRLCVGEGPKAFNNGGYKSSKIHLVRKNEVIMGGDVEKLDGSGNHSSFEGQRYIKDENFIIPHSGRGLIR